MLNRKYYATGFGTYVLNSISKRLFRINTGDFLCHFTSRVTNPKNIKLKGEKLQSVYLSFATSGGCYYQGLNGIEISEGTIWSYNCCFVSANHSFKDLEQHEPSDPIIIANCVVLPSVNIGDYSIIGAGTIVNKDVPPYSIAVGNPAKVIAKRCEVCLAKLKLGAECKKCMS